MHRTERCNSAAALFLVGLAMLQPAAAAESARPCAQVVTLGCVRDGEAQDRLTLIIRFEAAPGGDHNYFLLKPHGPRGRTRRCTDAEILIEESSVRFSVDRRTGRYSLTERRFDGDVDESAGVCTDISQPDAGRHPR
jgi:hypothetical protein